MKPRGDRRWDVFLRATAVAALIGIPVVLIAPGSVTLVWLAVLSLPSNSPLSPILPTMFEPLIVEAAKWEPVWAVTAVATAGYMYTEYINWHVYTWVLGWERLARFRSRPAVRWCIALFSFSPFWMVVICAVTPLPFWPARVLAILYRYPLWRFMLATLVGRIPGFFVYAWIGDMLSVPTWILAAVIVVPAVVVIVTRLIRGVPLLAESAPEPAEWQPGQLVASQEPSGTL
ncbi:MAG: VTT domain-containing protein [Gemmatimonadales bacterium]